MSQNQKIQPLTLEMLRKKLGGWKLTFLQNYFPPEILFCTREVRKKLESPEGYEEIRSHNEIRSFAVQKGENYTVPFIPVIQETDPHTKDISYLQINNLSTYYRVLFGPPTNKLYKNAIPALRERVAGAIISSDACPEDIKDLTGAQVTNLGKRLPGILEECISDDILLPGNLRPRVETLLKSDQSEKETLALMWLLLGALLQDWIDVVLEYYDASFQRLKPAPKASTPQQSKPAPGHELPDEITMCSEDPRLNPDRLEPVSYQDSRYIERDARTKQLECGLQYGSFRPVVLLSGAGGSGKTELARWYASLSNQYKSVLWLTYSKQYRSAGEGKSLGELLEDCAFSDVKTQLPLWKEDRLIVVDNLDVQDNVLMGDLLNSDLTGHAPILITTRDKHMFQDSSSEHLRDKAEFCSICLNDDLKEQAETAAAIFQSCCPQDCKDEKLLIPEICARLDNNLLLVSYLAKNTKSTPSQILSDLNRLPVLNPAGALRNLGRVSHHYQTVGQPEALIRYVFGDLLDDRRFADQPLQAQALALLALLPGAAVDQNLAAALVGDGEGTLAAEDLSALEKADLLRKSGEGRVTLHSLMAEILLSYQPAVQALMKDAAFWGQILENWLTMKRSSTTPALIYAVLSHVYTLGEDVCAAQRLALLIEQGNPDELFRKLHPAVPGAILACAEHKTERRFVWWDLQKRQEETILRAQHRYYLDGAAAEPLSGGQDPVRCLHLYVLPDQDASLPLVIPDRLGGKPVTIIPDYFCCFFYTNQHFLATEIRLPKGIRSIGNIAFFNLSLLPDVQFSLDKLSALESIGDWVFAYSCFDSPLILPDSLRKIGNHTFHGSYFSGDLRLPEGLQSLGESAFARSVIENGGLYLPSSLTSIAAGAFEDCHFSGSPNLSDEINRIEERASQDSTDAKRLQLPANLRFIGANAFVGCEGIQMPNQDEIQSLIDQGAVIDPNAFLASDTDDTVEWERLQTEWGEVYDNKALAGVLRLPDTLSAIPAGAFEGFSSLTEVILPDAITRIEPRTFQGCSALRCINLNQIQFIGQSAFEGCSSLDIPLLPPKLEQLEGDVFKDCTSLSGTISIPRGEISHMEKAPFSNCPNLFAPVAILGLPEEKTIPLDSSDALVPTVRFDVKAKTLKEKYLKEYTLCGSLILPPFLEYIFECAFRDQWRISGSLEIPASVLLIGESGFENCGLNKKVVILGSPRVCTRAFAYTEITDVEFHGKDTVLEPDIFLGCKDLTIYAPADSTAARYAQANGIPFVPLT